MQIIPRDRLIVRHLGRLLVAKQTGAHVRGPGVGQAHARRRSRAAARRATTSAGCARASAEERERDRDPRPEITASVVNQSSRNGLKPRIIVLHTTEGHNRPGLSDLHGLVSFFDNPHSQVSSHVANDAEGNDARIVPDERKAFTQAAFNSIALSIEQIGFASQTQFPQAQLENTARWIAHWSRKWGIPITHSTTSGVCQHRDLGPRAAGTSTAAPTTRWARSSRWRGAWHER